MTPGEVERLAILMEELAEAQQAVGKILRFGWGNVNPDQPGAGTNRDQLEEELAHVLTAAVLLKEAGELPMANLDERVDGKLGRLSFYVREAENLKLVRQMLLVRDPVEKLNRMDKGVAGGE